MSRLDNFEEILDSYEGREPKQVTPVFYNGLEWQPRAYREQGKTEKAEFFFDDSQEKLVQAGFERHPLSAEVFSFIFAYLDDQKRATKILTPEQAEVARDMLEESSGELCCQAIETIPMSSKQIVRIYELVRALPTSADGTGYEKSGKRYSGDIKIFYVNDLEPGKYHFYKNIHNEHDDLIKYLTSRKYEDLPEEAKADTGIRIPQIGVIHHIGPFIKWASRGVRLAKVKTR